MTLVDNGGMVWIGLYRHDVVVQEFGIHARALNYAVCAHKRPKLEHIDA